MRHDGNEATVTVTGEFGLESLGVFTAAIDDLDNRTSLVVLDLDGLTYVDSTGARAARVIEQRFERVVIRNAPPMARRVFELTGLDHLLDEG